MIMNIPNQEVIDEINNDLTAEDDLKFRFATDGEGNYGYLGADDSFIPFKSGFNLPFAIKLTGATTYTCDKSGRYFVMIATNSGGGAHNWASHISISSTGSMILYDGKHVGVNYWAYLAYAIIDLKQGETVTVTSTDNDRFQGLISQIEKGYNLINSAIVKDNTCSITVPTISSSKTYIAFAVGNTDYRFTLPSVLVDRTVTSQNGYIGFQFIQPKSDYSNLTFSFFGGSSYGCSTLIIFEKQN